MPDVTIKNFEQEYSSIVEQLSSSFFIAIDCEFSGILPEKASLFDSSELRYEKLRCSLKEFEIIQIGLTAFRYDRQSNKFNSASHSFYLMPSTFIDPKRKFIYLGASVKFLCKYGFDFNKLFHNGINYLNAKEEEEVKKMLIDETWPTTDHYSEVIAIQCSKVAEWRSTSELEKETTLHLDKEQDGIVIYLIHQKIRNTFPDIWTHYDKFNVIRIEKVTLPEKEKLLADENENILLKKKLLNSILGFSNIIKVLKNLKKPIVGHNFLIDLMMIYKQFFTPLPASYQQFKKKITEIFPHVYDTKYCSSQLKSILPKDCVWKNSSLSDLYCYFKQDCKELKFIYMPIIEHEENYTSFENFHEGGFDSFCTGFCFIKMAYMLSTWDKNKNSFSISGLPVTTKWLLSAVDPFKNCVNLPHGKINYIMLDGPDPNTTLTYLFIQSKQNQPLNISKISEEISKLSPSVDIKLINRYKGVMAVQRQRQAVKIIDHFESSNEFYVTKYNFFKHSNFFRATLASGMIASTVLFVIFFQRYNRII